MNDLNSLSVVLVLEGEEGRWGPLRVLSPTNYDVYNLLCETG